MKRICTITVIIALALISFACNARKDKNVYQEIVAVNQDSTPKIVYSYKLDDQGKPTKEKVHETHYFSSKKKYIDGGIKNDKREGPWFAYYENGKINTEAFYVDGKENGDYKVYYENGNLHYAGHYNMGTCEGEWLFYSPDGIVEKRLIADENTIICASCPRCAEIKKKQTK